MNAFIRFVGIFLIMTYSMAAHAVTEILVRVAHINHPQAAARNVEMRMQLHPEKPVIAVKAELRQKTDQDWMQLHLGCQTYGLIQNGAFSCAEGSLKNKQVNFPFSLTVHRLFDQGLADIDAELMFKNASFSDEAGLHAAEKLHGSVAVALKQQGNLWSWRTIADWQAGEVFWQPFYIANGGHRLSAIGNLDGDLLNIQSAHLNIKNVGELDADGQLRLSDGKWTTLNAQLPSLNLSAAYPMLFKPLLANTAFDNVLIEGDAALRLRIKDAALQSFALQLKDVDVADIDQKFAVYKLNANIPWRYDGPESASIRYASGELLNLPLGKADITAVVNRYSLVSPSIRLPILDGALGLTDVSAAYIAGQWYWHLSAVLEPVSMADFSTRLNLPRMLGKASATIPLVTYSAGKLTTDGSVVLNVFEGTATVTELTMQNPLGIAPKLNADITMRNLDLGELTRTFSFGAIEGKLDGDIEALELQNWKPVRFDAMLQSSPGKYPKKISQRAVQNISALGGGGAAAAIQRSFLRFFEQFNYGKMGLSCRLRNDICEMGGIESTPHGYVIVKGSGIPAITVMGYNQTVGWNELLSRIKRVTDGNSKAVVK